MLRNGCCWYVYSCFNNCNQPYPTKELAALRPNPFAFVYTSLSERQHDTNVITGCYYRQIEVIT